MKKRTKFCFKLLRFSACCCKSYVFCKKYLNIFPCIVMIFFSSIAARKQRKSILYFNRLSAVFDSNEPYDIVVVQNNWLKPARNLSPTCTWICWALFFQGISGATNFGQCKASREAYWVQKFQKKCWRIPFTQVWHKLEVSIFGEYKWETKSQGASHSGQALFELQSPQGKVSGIV